VIFIGLNAVRFLTIVSLLLVFSSTILVMVTNVNAVNRFHATRISNSTDIMVDCDYIQGSTVPNQPAGVFLSIVASLLIIFQVIILLLSELGWPAIFFDRFFPVLGANFGLGALGVFLCLIGAQILSHHVDDFTLVAAFFIFSIGCLNILLGLIFREDAKAHRALSYSGSNNKGPIITPFTGNVTAQSPAFTFSGDADAVSFASWKASDMRKAAYGFGRQDEEKALEKAKEAQQDNISVVLPEENLPRYPSPPTRASSPRSHRARRPSPSPSRSRSSRSASVESSSSRSSTASSMSDASSFHGTPTDLTRQGQAPHEHVSPSRYGRNPVAF
ncbi:hypothetical protein R3P38DRAFT_2491253, partial [Favolaschia claudopus]